MSEEDSVSALGAMYQGEKTDSIGIFNVAMVMMAIAAAYVISAATLSSEYGKSVPWGVVLLLPFPLWLIAAYHSLIALSGMTHGVSLAILEYSLYQKSRLPANGPLRGYVGSRLSDRIMDIGQATWPHKLTTVFVYVGFYSGIGGYTIYVIVAAWAEISLGLAVVAICGYAVATAVVGISWLQGFRLLGKAAESKADYIQTGEKARLKAEAAADGSAALDHTVPDPLSDPV